MLQFLKIENAMRKKKASLTWYVEVTLYTDIYTLNRSNKFVECYHFWEGRLQTKHISH